MVPTWLLLSMRYTIQGDKIVWLIVCILVFRQCGPEHAVSNLEVLQYDTTAAALAKYCNQAAGVQEQLPVSVKKGSTTWRWEGLIDRAHSIKESYEDLVRILSEPHRDRAILIASVNRKLNAEILDFMEPFRKLFETLQNNTKPTINFAVLIRGGVLEDVLGLEDVLEDRF